MSAPAKGITGRKRRYKTKSSVKLADRIAGALISVGGICTILAVTGVFVFLAVVVVPLFQPATSEPFGDLPQIQAGGNDPGIVAADEYLVAGWLLEDGGATARSFRLDNGNPLQTIDIFDGRQPRAVSYSQRDGLLAAAFADGTIQLVSLGFKTDYLVDESMLPASLLDLAEGQLAEFEGAVIERTPSGQLRSQKLVAELQPPIETGIADIQLIDVSVLSSGPVIASLGGDGLFRLQTISSKRNLLTGKVTTTLSGGSLSIGTEHPGQPQFLLLSGRADNAYIAWRDGALLRLDTRDSKAPKLAEKKALIGGDGELTALSFLIGKTTLVTGDSRGRVNAWFTTKPADAATIDGALLTLVHRLGTGPAPVSVLSPSERSRLLAVGFADGTVRLNHVTSAQVLHEESVGSGMVRALAISPKDNAFTALTPSGLSLWRFDAGHPAATMHTLFGKVHYEGMNEPAYIWQSSSGTDDFEPKYGMIPLIFGTLKGTFYSLLFGVPLALLAAVYTSEFLEDKRLRARIKPLVEMMESLPTVVLGFLAALVFAVFVEGRVADVLACFFTVPLVFISTAYLFQLLPVPLFVRFSRWRFLLVLVIALPLGLLLATLFGPLLEHLLFAGDIKAWLDGQVGSGSGGWFIMFIPLSTLAVVLLLGLRINPWLRQYSADLSRLHNGVLEIAKMAICTVVILLLAWLAATALSGIGFDSRGDFPLIGPVLNTYVQRNALVVGFIMGFAIIPAVYTLAEDALSSVPEHLRAGSLAAGATPWQTAVRIIIPTAASGLFSAVMLGLGRAVGETMIVLMATGNTPVLEWNIFNGFRTLSANIAVELPEAVVFGTHFRVLFLAALTLFLMTFVVNTVAEVIRQRFRKRAFEL